MKRFHHDVALFFSVNSSARHLRVVRFPWRRLDVGDVPLLPAAGISSSRSSGRNLSASREGSSCHLRRVASLPSWARNGPGEGRKIVNQKFSKFWWKIRIKKKIWIPYFGIILNNLVFFFCRRIYIPHFCHAWRKGSRLDGKISLFGKKFSGNSGNI